jgi:hypothetical protein
MSLMGVKSIVGTARDQSIKLPFLLMSGYKDSAREERATKYEPIPNNYILQKIITVVREVGARCLQL